MIIWSFVNLRQFRFARLVARLSNRDSRLGRRLILPSTGRPIQFELVQTRRMLIRVLRSGLNLRLEVARTPREIDLLIVIYLRLLLLLLSIVMVIVIIVVAVSTGILVPTIRVRRSGSLGKHGYGGQLRFLIWTIVSEAESKLVTKVLLLNSISFFFFFFYLPFLSRSIAILLLHTTVVLVHVVIGLLAVPVAESIVLR